MVAFISGVPAPFSAPFEVVLGAHHLESTYRSRIPDSQKDGFRVENNIRNMMNYVQIRGLAPNFGWRVQHSHTVQIRSTDP